MHIIYRLVLAGWGGLGLSWASNSSSLFPDFVRGRKKEGSRRERNVNDAGVMRGG